MVAWGPPNIGKKKRMNKLKTGKKNTKKRVEK
jgi:hypothetical protein